MHTESILLIFLLLTGSLLPAFPQASSDKGQEIAVRIYDENHELTAARVRFSNLEGQYFAPVGHQADFAMTMASDPEGNEVGVILDGGRRFAYIDGTFEILLPATQIRLEIVKGFCYKIYDDTLDFASHGKSLEIHLKPWLDLPADNWYSGDVHVHYLDPEVALLAMKAEDVNVCNVLISDFTIDHDRFRGSIEPISDDAHIVYYGQEFREDRLGHINLLNLKESLVPPAVEMRDHQYPLNTYKSEEIRKNGGHISWAHFAAWPGLEGPMALVLKKVDAVELLCTIDPFHQPIFVPDVVPEVRMNSGLKLWYRLLNCGLQIPATAGTDKMNNQVTVGANRVFAEVDGPFNYDNWIQALNDGRTFISNSPFLVCEIDGQGPGSTLQTTAGQQHRIVAEVWSQLPIDRLEIIANGEMIAEQIIPSGEFHAKIEIDFSGESSWICARAYQFSSGYTRQGLSLSQRRDAGAGPTLLNQYFGTLRPETVFAHSSPIYLLKDDRPIRSRVDAEYFLKYMDNAIRWLDEEGSFPSEDAKKEVLGAFYEGRRAFEDLVP